MRRRLAALLLAFVAVVGLVAATSVEAAPPAAAAGGSGPVGTVVRVACEPSGIGLIGALTGHDYCKSVGQVAQQKADAAWNDVWNSELGDVIKSGVDLAKWVVRKTLTMALQGPSLRLEDTGLFGPNATLAGMLVWLGYVIAAFGAMWQLGKMAVTGKARHAGQAVVGWVENVVLTTIGLTILSSLLVVGDTMTNGLVSKVFGNPGAAYDHIVEVLIPAGIQNPMMVAGVVSVLVLIGGIQLVLVFLRQSVIPIQGMLLPVAGAGRVGGETTRKWAPRLINAILTALVYKPLLALIICIGFTELGHASTLTEWLRGVATLTLGVLAPTQLMKAFAPLADQVGGGLAAGGALGAAVDMGAFVAARRGGGSSGGGEGDAPASPVDHARHVQQTMPSSYRGPDDPDDPPPSGGGGVPAQPSAPQPNNGPGTPSPGGAGKAAGAANPAGLGIQVLDGINDGIQRGAGEMGDGGNRL